MDALLDADTFGDELDDTVARRIALHAFAEPRDRLVAVDDLLSLAKILADKFCRTFPRFDLEEVYLSFIA